MNRSVEKVNKLVNRIKMNIFGTEFRVIVDLDKKHTHLDFTESSEGELKGRVFLQVAFTAECKKTNHVDEWKSAKHYLSDYMTDDEVIKTCWKAFEQAVKHETMESFTVDGIILFNPHINFEELLKISNKEVTRDDTLRIVK